MLSSACRCLPGLLHSKGPSSLLQTLSGQRAAVWSISDLFNKPSNEPVDVCFLDPRTLVTEKDLQVLVDHKADEDVVTPLQVPGTFLKALSQGVNELGDMDDPMNNWYFGKRAEIFQYTFVGSHKTQSGFTCIVTREVLKRLAAGQGSALPPWDKLKNWITTGTITFPCKVPPLVFAGLMVETAEAAVYKLEEEGKVVGVLISSETVTRSDVDQD